MTPKTQPGAIPADVITDATVLAFKARSFARHLRQDRTGGPTEPDDYDELAGMIEKLIGFSERSTRQDQPEAPGVEAGRTVPHPLGWKQTIISEVWEALERKLHRNVDRLIVANAVETAWHILRRHGYSAPALSSPVRSDEEKIREDEQSRGAERNRLFDLYERDPDTFDLVVADDRASQRAGGAS